ncbi:antibiotic biosynthesis monooxygenase family protein [Amycolatopsis pigmentata]|uniref:Antibiotic biosynthesis monooxygenase family protein n=1 Tax=Amycolatopsis pigmentata TaxID=450801 RepID=A0ABW5FS87_9PSEU
MTYHRYMNLNDGKSTGPVTFINVFEIPREDVEVFKAGWRRLAGIMASAPGFRDARLHEAISGETRFQLVNVAQWDSEEAWRAAAANPEMRTASQEAGADPVFQRAIQNTGLYRPIFAFGTEG